MVSLVGIASFATEGEAPRTECDLGFRQPITQVIPGLLSTACHVSALRYTLWGSWGNVSCSQPRSLGFIWSEFY